MHSLPASPLGPYSGGEEPHGSLTARVHSQGGQCSGEHCSPHLPWGGGRGWGAQGAGWGCSLSLPHFLLDWAVPGALWGRA